MKTSCLQIGPMEEQDGLVLGLILCLILGTGCEYRARTEAPLPPDSLEGNRPSQVTRNPEFVLNREGKRRAVIDADLMKQYRTDDSTYSVWRTLGDSVRVRSFVFDEAGDSSATITADSVVFFNQEGRYEAYGNVVVVTDDERRLESEHLTWNQSDRTIRTERFVHITTPTEDVRGNGLVADEDLKTYQIGRFTAKVDVEEGEEENP